MVCVTAVGAEEWVHTEGVNRRLRRHLPQTDHVKDKGNINPLNRSQGIEKILETKSVLKWGQRYENL